MMAMIRSRDLRAALVVLLVLARASVGAAAPSDGPMAKVAPELQALYEAYLVAQGRGAQLVPVTPWVMVVEGRVIIDAVASGEVNDLKADLVALGMQQAASAGRIVSGQLPISAIGAMAALPSLRFARAAMSSTHQGTPGGVR